jgi:uncharacterized LabA/DUF88 family protein
MNLPHSKTVVRVESENSVKRLAVLIDADNAQAAVIESLLEEVAKFGEATVRRIYGDFTSPRSASWKQVLNKYSIKPVQQFAYTTGKNATDSTMIIDAMDLLYTRRFDGFCLVTSDSDFTGLAVRLREEGLEVFGFGEQKTPESFRNACHQFIPTEVFKKLTAESDLSSSSNSSSHSLKQTSDQGEVLGSAKNLEELLMKALEGSIDDSGWAQLGTFGSYLRKIQPDFDARLYNHKKLSDLVRSRKDLFVTEERVALGGTNKDLYLRAKSNTALQ